MANIAKEQHLQDMMRKKKVLDTILLLAGILFAVLSTVLGSKFDESHLLFIGDSWAFGLSMLTSAFLAIAMIYAGEISLDEWINDSTIGITTALFAFIVCVNVSRDYFGSAEWANNIKAPVNEKSAPIEAKITDVDGKIADILIKYRWCEKHGKGGKSHDCPSTVSLASVSGIKDGHANYGHTPDEDRAEIAKLEAERATYVSQLDSETTAFNAVFKNYESTHENARGTLRGVSVALNFMFVFFTVWRVKFKSGKIKDAEPEPSPVPQQNLQGTAPIPQQNLQGTAPVPQQNLQGTAPVPQQNLQGTAPVPQQNAQGTAPVPQQNAQGTAPVPQSNLQGTAPVPQQNLQGTPPVPQSNLQGTPPTHTNPLPSDPLSMDQMENAFASLIASNPMFFNEWLAKYEYEAEKKSGRTI